MSRTAPETATGSEFDSDRSSPADAEPAPEEMRVLVVSGLAHKNERHYGPLAAAADETTLVCLDPRYAIDDATYLEVPAVGPRPLRVVLLFFIALLEGYRNEYDAVASISLLPYGLYALALTAIYGYPASLGIIGIDLDHHAKQWYGPLPRWAFRRFDAVSVPGPSHVDDLEACGVPRNRIEILANAIDVERYRPDTLEEQDDHEYDFVWVGRFSEEKDPVRFVDALIALENRGEDHEFRAVMVGDGPLRAAVEEKLERHGLRDRVDRPGWVDDPLKYYQRSATVVLTSRRDALPLVMLEAMAVGLPPIVPPVGSVPDIVTDGENGIVVSDRDPDGFATAMARCLDDSDRRRTLGANATAIRSAFSYEQAERDWERILTTAVAGDSRQ
ncbi:glycosyltransferase family 4 protein [Natronobacterium gregoryi]|uniref:Glycosyltransferase n=2 Tax=Natronobacterium gregoryi TaxID=44930 RepID=L0AKA7_NATGS|nr:glycosyltransferase family 4 protein [Natronobacterium gregoryi]AFZ74226.1 glycosyltransferase [Natronobacterium gregoryi SP2]ELY63682.1 group 1 glycosyl transferase [Natronobacterium gregoryi SP2]PLK21987.1 glycosyltransferase family 1 protein [Natronobacterium gregoryi SP2]SFI51839.1 Glycosyltransferase involved in cell wall bisynthesis [Natronobacterium gregoryi]